MDFRLYDDRDNPAISKYTDHINLQAKATNVPPCALAAIVEIESGGRNILQAGMPASDGCGVGLCQITYDVNWKNPAAPTYNGFALLTPSANLYVAGRYFFRPAIDAAIALRNDYRAWMDTLGDGQLLWWAFAAYNAGPTAIAVAAANKLDPDRATTDHYASRSLAVYLRNVERSAPEPAAR